MRYGALERGAYCGKSYENREKWGQVLRGEDGTSKSRTGDIPGIDGDERSAARTRTYRLILRTLILILTEYRLEYTKSSLARACRYA